MLCSDMQIDTAKVFGIFEKQNMWKSAEETKIQYVARTIYKTEHPLKHALTGNGGGGVRLNRSMDNREIRHDI